VTEILFNSLNLLAILSIPAVVFAVAAHFLEISIQSMLAARFGWRSIMWTGWLGTPIHELSHVVACWVFGHRVDEVRLFDPDVKTGRLGFVRHSYRRGNWFEELGNVFIGTAPLVGGSLVMLLLLFLFFPKLAGELLRHPALTEASSWGELFNGLLHAFSEFITNLFTWKNLAKLRLWVFLYLVLCVASHMAPSRSDYEGAGRGAVVAVVGAFSASILTMLFSRNPFAVALSIFQLAIPIIIMGLLSIVLCFVIWLALTIFVYFVDRWRLSH
jgi:hypothetical protein